MLDKLGQRLKDDFQASYRSIKLPEVEEWFDIYFSRYFGYYLALLSKKIGLSPHQVSLLSLLTGFIAGAFFYFQDQVGLILWACFFITFSGLLDSADGQLARMTNTASDLGRKIDAIIDTFAFVACYTGGAIYFLPSYGWFIAPIAILAGYSHSVKSAVYEFYKTEFILYLKNAQDHRIPHISEVKSTTHRGGFWNECLYYLEIYYIGGQATYISRPYDVRLKFQNWATGPDRDQFLEMYKKYNHKILTQWALICGTNVHRTVLMVCSLFGRMDIYFFIAIGSFPLLWWVNVRQKSFDSRLVAEFESVLSVHA